MNGCKKRRSSFSILAVLSTFTISFIHAQQLINRDVQTTFQNGAAFRPSFQQNPNFHASPSASSVSSAHDHAQRILVARQISRHSNRQRQRSLIRTTTHQPTVAQLTRNVYRQTRFRTKPTVLSSSTNRNSTQTQILRRAQHQPKLKSNRAPNISRRQGFRRQTQQVFRPGTVFRGPVRRPFTAPAAVPMRLGRQPPPAPQPPQVQQMTQARRVIARQPEPVTRRNQFIQNQPQSPIRSFQPPLSPIPFGAIQARPISQQQPQQRRLNPIRNQTPAPRPIQRSRLEQNQGRTISTVSPSTFSPSSPSTRSSSSKPTASPQSSSSSSSTTTTSTTPSPPIAIHRPIRVQSVNANLRRKPLIGTTARLHHSRRIPNNTTRSMGETRKNSHQPTHRVVTDRLHLQNLHALSTTTQSAPEQLTRVNPLKGVDDIEAAILRAVFDSSTPAPTLRARVHRLRTTTQRPRNPPRVDSIEEAVLRAVLESTPVTTAQPEIETTQESTTLQDTTATTIKSESTSLFPAFATRRQAHRRRPFSSTTLTTTQMLDETVTSTTPAEETTTATTTRIISSTSTELPSIIPTTVEETSTSMTTTSEATTSSSSSDSTLSSNLETLSSPRESDFKTDSEPISESLEDDAFEEKNVEPNRSDLRQIEQNVIAALSSTPPTPEPPAPFPSEDSITSTDSSAGPPGSLPPSDDIVDELNGANDFLQVAQKLHLLKRLLH